MVDFECPAAAQRDLETRDLVNRIPNEATPQDFADHLLNDGDKFARITCSVGDCAVKATSQHRKTQTIDAVNFQTINPSLCARREVSIFDTDTTAQ